MKLSPLPCQSKTFYEILRSSPELDQRDERGKRHELAVVLTGLVLGLLSNRDGKLSSLQRHMSNTFSRLRAQLGILQTKAVSRSQLPLILERVNLTVFERLVFEFYGIELSETEKQWFSADGKELRGSIAAGNKRGEAVVEIVQQGKGQVMAQTFYSGSKDSEIPALRQLLVQSGAQGQKISLDALHLNPGTLHSIESAKGVYVVGLKENQGELLSEMQWYTRQSKYTFTESNSEKGHGRVEQREYRSFDLQGAYLDKRWESCGLKTVVHVRRSRWICRSGEQQEETALFLSNARLENLCQAKELFEAIRGHWSVETTNHIRDVSFREDALRTKKTKSQEQWLYSEH